MAPFAKFILCAGLLLCAGPRWARAEDAPSSPPAILSRGDALFIRIEGIGDGIPEYREIIDSDGRIELPFIGFHLADGKSIPALEAEMATAYATANLSTCASVRIVYAAHFEPPPARSNLVRAQDPRRPAPAQTALPSP